MSENFSLDSSEIHQCILYHLRIISIHVILIYKRGI